MEVKLEKLNVTLTRVAPALPIFGHPLLKFSGNKAMQANHVVWRHLLDAGKRCPASLQYNVLERSVGPRSLEAPVCKALCVGPVKSPLLMPQDHTYQYLSPDEWEKLYREGIAPPHTFSMLKQVNTAYLIY